MIQYFGFLVRHHLLYLTYFLFWHALEASLRQHRDPFYFFLIEKDMVVFEKQQLAHEVYLFCLL